MKWSTQRCRSVARVWPITVTLGSPVVTDERLEFHAMLFIGEARLAAVCLPLVNTLGEAQKLATEWAKKEMLSFAELIKEETPVVKPEGTP